MQSTTAEDVEVEQEFRNIPIDLIDDPQAPVRETMDEVALRELVESVGVCGLIEPLVVKDNNDRFEVVAGHRRRIACQIAGLQMVPCMIRRKRRVSDLAIMIHENAFREDMNPIEEARFYARALTEEAENDVDKLCGMLKRSRNHVEGRLVLLLGHPTVMAALEQGRIPIGTAHSLNRLKNVALLPQLLDAAVNQGANSKAISQWVREADQLPTIEIAVVDPNDPAAGCPAPIPPGVPECIFCQSQKYPHMMSMVWMHAHCLDALNAMMTRGA